jgi:SAM-dependent methyltransferase
VFDAGCGNGLLNQLMAEAGITVLGMDLSESIVRAFQHNPHQNAMFIQGDVQYPPVLAGAFDIVHCSGVLICTNNTELSFSCIDPCVKEEGKLSVWLYHPRKNLSHNLSNFLRRFTSKLPVKFQYYLYLFTFFPLSYVLKRLKGNKQNAREMMIDILDWFSPQYRWEHTPKEAENWFLKRNYRQVRITTKDIFGFNIIGIKNKWE